MTPALSRRNGASVRPLILGAPPASWDGFIRQGAGCRQAATRLLEIALKSAGVSLVALLATALAALAIFCSLKGANALIGYDFSQNVFSFLWNYNYADWSWHYRHDEHSLMGYLGLLLGAGILILSPYVLFGIPLAWAIGVFHWIDRPFRRQRAGEGIWCSNGVDDPARLGELREDQLCRRSLGSPRVRAWLGRAMCYAALLFTGAAYLLLLVVFKAVAQSLPTDFWIIAFAAIPPLGFGVSIWVLTCLFLGLCFSFILPVELTNRLLDGEKSIGAFQGAFRSVSTRKKGRSRGRGAK